MDLLKAAPSHLLARGQGKEQVPDAGLRYERPSRFCGGGHEKSDNDAGMKGYSRRFGEN